MNLYIVCWTIIIIWDIVTVVRKLVRKQSMCKQNEKKLVLMRCLLSANAVVNVITYSLESVTAFAVPFTPGEDACHALIKSLA